mgnify:CR=1 FL=1
MAVFGRIRGWLRPSGAKGGALALVLVGVVATAAFFGGFNVFAHYTNRTEFCVSCHEMEKGPYTELKKTLHYNNRTGVRAGCADCHVPKEFGPKLAAKVMAAKDVWHHLLGTIDTPEKFEAQRLTMAKRVWAKMSDTQSRECRNCHNFEAMNLDDQGRRAKLKHPQARQDGKHCIECHKGIVHELPQGYEGD